MSEHKTAFHHQFFFDSLSEENTKGKITWKKGEAKELVSVPHPLRVQTKNEDQACLAAALMSEIPVVTVLGKAGSGKTFLAIAAAMEFIEQGRADEIIIMRPMSETGRWKMGALPGVLEEKYAPFLQGYYDNIEQLFKIGQKGKQKEVTQEIIQAKYPVRMQPLQYIRGASWVNKVVIIDEAQVLNKEEILSIGTRIGENTKLILLGDLKQRDNQITEKDSGLRIFIEKSTQSPLVAHIELRKCVRSPVCDMFIEVLDG